MVFPCQEVIFSMVLAATVLSVSEVTLGIFGVQFWGFSVLQRHAVSLPGGDIFHGVFPSEDQVCSHLGTGCERYSQNS